MACTFLSSKLRFKLERSKEAGSSRGLIPFVHSIFLATTLYRHHCRVALTCKLLSPNEAAAQNLWETRFSKHSWRRTFFFAKGPVWPHCGHEYPPLFHPTCIIHPTQPPPRSSHDSSINNFIHPKRSLHIRGCILTLSISKWRQTQARARESPRLLKPAMAKPPSESSTRTRGRGIGRSL